MSGDRRPGDTGQAGGAPDSTDVPGPPGTGAGADAVPGRPPAGNAGVAEVVVCVHNALDEVRACLDSVLRQTDERHGVILVDDGSEAPTRDLLAAVAERQPRVRLLRAERATGFTRAANRGLRQSAADLVVLLNSDTIVTPRWLERLIACAGSDPAIGLVGPLTNRGAHQSIPTLPDRRRGPRGNPLPPGWSPDRVAAVVAGASTRSFPRVPLLDGFCVGIGRAVIDAIGYLDEESFPRGYGETYDYCFRAAAAGFALAVADDAYIFHAGASSYTEEGRRELGDVTGEILRRKWGRERFRQSRRVFATEPSLVALRAAVGGALAGPPPP